MNIATIGATASLFEGLAGASSHDGGFVEQLDKLGSKPEPLRKTTVDSDSRSDRSRIDSGRSDTHKDDLRSDSTEETTRSSDDDRAVRDNEPDPTAKSGQQAENDLDGRADPEGRASSDSQGNSRSDGDVEDGEMVLGTATPVVDPVGGSPKTEGDLVVAMEAMPGGEEGVADEAPDLATAESTQTNAAGTTLAETPITTGSQSDDAASGAAQEIEAAGPTVEAIDGGSQGALGEAGDGDPSGDGGGDAQTSDFTTETDSGDQVTTSRATPRNDAAQTPGATAATSEQSAASGQVSPGTDGASSGSVGTQAKSEVATVLSDGGSTNTTQPSQTQDGAGLGGSVQEVVDDSAVAKNIATQNNGLHNGVTEASTVADQVANANVHTATTQGTSAAQGAAVQSSAGQPSTAQPAATAGTMSPAMLATARVLDTLEIMSRQPPPRTLTLDLTDLHGVRVTLAIDSGGVNVSVSDSGAGNGNTQEWARQLEQLLSERDFGSDAAPRDGSEPGNDGSARGDSGPGSSSANRRLSNIRSNEIRL